MEYGAPDHRRIIIEFLIGNVFTLSYSHIFFNWIGQGLERVLFASLHGDFLSGSYLADSFMILSFWCTTATMLEAASTGCIIMC
jgi:hypothetical protein